jgi:hypothetical protein
MSDCVSCDALRAEIVELEREHAATSRALAVAERTDWRTRALVAEQLLTRVMPIIEAARAWEKAPHVLDENHYAGDCDDCPAREALDNLRAVIGKVGP